MKKWFYKSKIKPIIHRLDPKHEKPRRRNSRYVPRELEMERAKPLPTREIAVVSDDPQTNFRILDWLELDRLYREFKNEV